MKMKVLGSCSKGNCYIFDDGEQQLILEAGVSYTKIAEALDFDFSRVVGTLVSHEHMDHAKSISKLTSKGHNVYSSAKTFKKLGIENHYTVPIENKKWKTLGNYKFMPFDVQHDAAEPFGFMIKHPQIGNLVFITDTYYVKYKFPQANHYLLECNFDDDIIKEKYADRQFLKNRIFQSHFSLKNCKDFLMANDLTNVRTITLIHLSDTNSDEIKFKNEIIGTTGKMTYIAKEGLEVKM